MHWFSRLNIIVIKFLNLRNKLNEDLLNSKKTKEITISSFDETFITDKAQINNHSLITIRTSESKNKHIFFLHSSLYTLEANVRHKKLIKKLVKKYNFTVSFIDYPLGPENNFAITIRMILNSYLYLIEKYKNDKFFLFGFSSGASLAISLLGILRDKDISPFPSKSVLISPWIDISLTNKEISSIEKKDIILTTDSLKKVSTKFLGNFDIKSPLIYPLNSNTYSLGEIFMVCSKKEIFYPDCKLYAEKLKKAKGTTKIIFKEYKDLFHEFLLFPLKESKKLLSSINSFLS